MAKTALLEPGRNAAPMNPVEQMMQEAADLRDTTPEADETKPRPYSTRTWAELMRMDLPPPRPVWGGIVLGGLGVIFGQGGLGKSRVALNLARNQVLGLPFAGLPTGPDPLRHLMMGSENSIHRLQGDARCMGAGLDAEQIARLDAHIRMATIERPEDAFISVASADNVAKWRATLDAFPPDVLWADPWGDLLDGEANSDEDARRTLAALRHLLRRVNPDAAIVILAHARTGAANVRQAIGYDAANFGKGSKALYSAARCVWNLAPGDETENPPLVAVHAKCNDAPRVRPRALRMDGETMLYHLDHDFDFEAWEEEVGQRAQGKNRPRRGARLADETAVAALGDATQTAAQVRQLLRDKGATRDEADDLTKRLVAAGVWIEWRPPLQHAPVWVGPPFAMQRRRAEFAEAAQGKIGI
jgi:hypothetical protein